MSRTSTKKAHKKFLVLWNEDPFSGLLKQHLGESNVVTSNDQLNTKKRGLGNFDAMLVLVELAWNGKRYSDFYGYDVVFELIRDGCEIPVVFCSFIDRKSLRTRTKSSALLNPIFPYRRLPLSSSPTDEFDVPRMTQSKWFYIRRCLFTNGAIADQLEHAFRFITDSSPPDVIHRQLENAYLYQRLLDPDTISKLNTCQRALDESGYGKLSKSLEELKQHLKMLVAEQSSETGFPPTVVAKSHHQILLVEDNPSIRETLREGFLDYFEVKAVGEGREAIDELTERADKYAAVVADLELLDENHNWQSVQGFEVLEFADSFSHLVLYGLTALPRRAVSAIQHKLRSRAIIKYKDAEDYLPRGWTFETFSEVLLEDIKKRNQYRKGPKRGSWNNGLLSYYYQVKDSARWEDILTEVRDCVDNFLSSEDNGSQLIPKSLFNVNETEFDDDRLKMVLKHRLVNLFYLYRDHQVSYIEMKELIGFKCSQQKQYFNSILGLSIQMKGRNSDIICIQKTDLLDEEKEWLKNRPQFKDDPTVQFDGLIDTVYEALRYIPQRIRNERNLPASLDNLKDCLRVLQRLLEIPLLLERRKYIAEGFDYYLKHNKTEMSELLLQDNGKEIIEKLREFLPSLA